MLNNREFKLAYLRTCLLYYYLTLRIWSYLDEKIMNMDLLPGITFANT